MNSIIKIITSTAGEVITGSIKCRTRIIIRSQETSNCVFSREIPQPTKIAKVYQSAPKKVSIVSGTVQLTMEAL